MLERVKTRLKPDEPDDDLLEELLTTAKDRIKLRVGEQDFPTDLETIAVEVTVKAYRRQFFEGIASENVSAVNTSFVSDILSEYSSELDMWLDRQGQKRVVRFL